MRRPSAWGLRVVLVAGLSSLATRTLAVPISVTYTDPPNVGFNDPTRGAARQAAFNFAVGIWSGLLGGTVPVVVDASMPSLGGTSSSAILGLGGATTIHNGFPGQPVANTFYVAALANELSGSDLNGAGMAELMVQMNADVDNATVLGKVNWYYGTDGMPPSVGSGKFDVDFVSVAVHEIGHGLGFESEIGFGMCVGGSNAGAECGKNADCASNTCDLSSQGTWFNGLPGIYDVSLVEPGVGQFPALTDAQRGSAVTSGNVFWNGTQVVAAHGGNAKIFAPNPSQVGSSISHWDPSVVPAQVLAPAYTGPNHDPGLTLPAFADEGWSVLSTTTTTSSTTTTTTLMPLCAPTPASGCRLAAPGGASVQLKANADTTKDQFKWKWTKGAATVVTDFKDPVGGSATYRVCVYDSSASTQPLMEMDVPPGGTCGTKPCWAATGTTGFVYKNKAGTTTGLTAMKLRAGVTGKALVQATGKGANLPLPTLGLTLPVTVQLLAKDISSTECWQTTFTAAKTDTAAQFSAKGP